MPDLKGREVIDLSWQERLSNAWQALQGKRAFGPGTPLAPRLPEDTSPPTPPLKGEGGQAVAPRQFQYPPSVNTSLMPRREYPNMTPFEQLRNLAGLYDVAAMCIAARVEEVQGLNWSVVAKDKKAQHSLQDECDAVEAFFQQPDRQDYFAAWVSSLVYEMYTTDALTIYKRPDQGGRLYALEPVDGSTIKPLLDERGRVAAYQQVVYGYPETEYSRQQLIYQPRLRRSFTPYGFPPTEWIILRVNMALRKQSFDLAWFTDGNIPDMIATPPEGMQMSPQQVQDFETWFNSVLEGDDRARRKVRFLAWDAKLKELRPFSYETGLDEWMLRVTCAAFGVPPQELGFTYDVNRSTAEMQEAVNERRGIKPLVSWLKSMIFDPLIRTDVARMFSPATMGATDSAPAAISYPGKPVQVLTSPYARLEFQWHFGDNIDELVQAQADSIYLGSGVVSADEVRVLRFGDTFDGDAPGSSGLPGQQAAMGGDGQLMGVQTGYEVGTPRNGIWGMALTPPELRSGSPSPSRGEGRQAEADLGRWRAKAAKALKMGKGAKVHFESLTLPPDLAAEVDGRLEKVHSAGELEVVFAEARRKLQAAPEVAAEKFFRDWCDYA